MNRHSLSGVEREKRPFFFKSSARFSLKRALSSFSKEAEVLALQPCSRTTIRICSSTSTAPFRLAPLFNSLFSHLFLQLALFCLIFSLAKIYANFSLCSHRWDHDISEWVKMSDDEVIQRKEEEETRKKEEEAKKNEKID